MNKELMQKIKNEGLWLLVLLALSIIAFKIVFYKESLLVVIRIAVSILWLFVLPGFIVMYYWHDKLEFGERILAAVPLSTALVAILSYYLGLLGLHIMYHGIVLPLAILITGAILIWRKH